MPSANRKKLMHGESIVQRLRMDLNRAFDVLEKRNRPLHKLLADQIEQDASGALSKLSKFLPQEVSLGGGSDFAVALGEVAKRIQERNDILALKEVAISNEEAGEIIQDAEIIDEKQTEVVQTRKLVQSIKSLAPKEEPEEVEEPEIVEPEPKPKVYRGKRGRPSKMDLRLSGELDE
tara:strand:- start:10 stop:540 length:531 start_codon:yes stop_codon:yes gene_type:complete